MGQVLADLMDMSATLAAVKYPAHNHKKGYSDKTCRACHPRPRWDPS